MREIHDLDQFDEHCGEHGSLADVVVQGVDLSDRAEVVRGLPCGGAAFLGCRLDRESLASVVERGAVVFPGLPELPFRPYRPTLYTQGELLAGWRPHEEGSFHRDALDSKIYEWATRHPRGAPLPVLDSLARRLHDHAVDDALGDHLVDHPDVTAVMGGHAMLRTDPAYRIVAELGRAMTRAGWHVATGGGPGAMEAANLGAWLAGHPDDVLDESLAVLGAENDYRNADIYLDVALEVRDRFGADGAAASLAVPTWFYGHEPTNVYATHVAKYFANSIREDGLLAIANRGVIFAPGSAGTTQEIFQDATQNHYRVFGHLSPMVLLDTEHWNERLPAAPLLTALAESATEPWGDMVTVTDDTDEAVKAILDR